MLNKRNNSTRAASTLSTCPFCCPWEWAQSLTNAPLVRVLCHTPAPQARVACGVILKATRLVNALPLGVFAPRRPLTVRSRCGVHAILRSHGLRALGFRLRRVCVRHVAFGAATTYSWLSTCGLLSLTDILHLFVNLHAL